MQEKWLGLMLVGTLVGTSVLAGGGGTGVHYLCGSQSLQVSFQLDNRPDRNHFTKGTKVLVHEPGFDAGFFVVSRFDDTGETVKLILSRSDVSGRRELGIEWLSNSILENIRVTYAKGSRRRSARDGHCTLLN